MARRRIIEQEAQFARQSVRELVDGLEDRLVSVLPIDAMLEVAEVLEHLAGREKQVSR